MLPRRLGGTLASWHGATEPHTTTGRASLLSRAELVALRILHDPPVPGRSLVDLADADCPQLFQPSRQHVEAAWLTVDIDVQAVLPGLAFGHLLKQQPPAAADAARLVVRMGWRIAA